LLHRDGHDKEQLDTTANDQHVMTNKQSREEEWRRCRDEKRNGVEKQKREEERACLYTT